MKKRDIVIESVIFLMFLILNVSVLKQVRNNYSKNKSIQNEILKIDEKIKKIDIELEKYNKFLENLENNFEQEKIARNKLKMVKKNEIIYKFIEKIKEE